MSEAAIDPSAAIPVENVLRDELAQGDIVLGTVAPILGHLVSTPDNSLFGDAIVAQVRGMAAHVAHQLLVAQGEAEDADDPHQFAQEQLGSCMTQLLAVSPFIAHCHALAIERQLTERLGERSAIDPVVSPLLHSLIASEDTAIASTAMAALAAQARFMQHQRRMELPLGELPADLFDAVLQRWQLWFAGPADVSERVDAVLRSAYDEGASRLALLARLVSGMGNGARAALAPVHAGVALFASALAQGSRQPRDVAVLSTSERQMGRLALALRATGLNPREVEEQFLLIHPDITLPEGFDLLRADRAAELLAASGLAAEG